MTFGAIIVHCGLRIGGRWLAVALAALAPLAAAHAQPGLVRALEAAAGKGDTRALMRLAAMYETAEGVPANFARSNQLYCEAARRGDPEAQVQLGLIYANGRSVPRDEGVASTLFAMAATQGHEHAKSLLDFMVVQLKKPPTSELPGCMRTDARLSLRMSVELSEPKAAEPPPEKRR